MRIFRIFLLIFLIRIFYENATQEVMFNTTVELFLKTSHRNDVMACDFIQNGKIRFSSGLSRNKI